MSQFQFRLFEWPIVSGSSKSTQWKDFQFNESSLDELMFLFKSVLCKRNTKVAAPQIYKEIMEFHGIDDSLVYSVLNFDFTIESNEYGVLKVLYKFETRLGDDAITKKALKAREKFEKRSEKTKHRVPVFPEFEPKFFTGKFSIME